MKELDPAACQAAMERWANRLPDPDPVTGCIYWPGKSDGQGYGQVSIAAKSRQAHRVALAAAMQRDIAPGMTVGHRCHDLAAHAGLCGGGFGCLHRLCVRPEHLAEQTLRDNVLSTPHTVQSIEAAKTHCPQGHPLDGENLIPANTSQGWRACLACHREQGRRRNALVRGAHELLGLSRRQYASQYGWSVDTARTILASEPRAARNVKAKAEELRGTLDETTNAATCWPEPETDDTVTRCGACGALWTADRDCGQVHL